MKKILVTGAGGFIAGHLAKSLHESGHEVVAVDKKPFNEWYQIIPGVKSLVLDLQYRDNCYQAVNGCDEPLIWAVWDLLRTTRPCAC